mgnify:CR=1 FL=1
MRWIVFLARKLARLIVLLAAVSVIAFTLVSLSPIDPIDAYIGADMLSIGLEQRAQIAARWGLDQPAPVRFLNWLEQLAQGNLGFSRVYNQPVSQAIGYRFATSLALMGVAWTVSGLLGFMLGVVAGAAEGSWFDQAIRLYAYTLASTPLFWMGLLLLTVFAVWLKMAPFCCAAPVGMLPEDVTLWQRLQHLALPAATLSIIGIANMALHTRQKMLDVMHSDYVLMARAMGESPWGVIRQHALRNVALPAVTLQFASLGELFGGAVLAEQVFSYPGLGQATILAGLQGDVPLLLGIVLFSTVFVFSGNTLADLIYQIVDPRIRLAEG